MLFDRNSETFEYIKNAIIIIIDPGMTFFKKRGGGYLWKYNPLGVKVNENICIGAAGDIADFQFLEEIMKQKQIEEECRFSICFKIKISNFWRKSWNRNRLKKNAVVVSVF